ncbi:MAG: sulfite exporter TauE/SafE family protein [Acidobacteriota bacterium]
MPETSSVMMILVIATIVRASLGFGEALIAVPLLALFMPVEEAVPLAVLVSITIALLILVADWRHVQYRSAGRLIFSTFFGIPVGLWLLTAVPEALVKAILALVIIMFAANSLCTGRNHSLQDDRLAWLFGFNAGILGGAYGMNGPPLAIYGTLRRWKPDHFRATLQAYFLPASMAGMAGYWFAGLWSPAVTDLYLSALPAVVLAVIGGRWLGRRLNAHHFKHYVQIGLLAIGAILLFQSGLSAFSR